MFIFLRFMFVDRKIDDTDYKTEEWLERVVIVGPPSGIKSATLKSTSNNVKFGIQQKFKCVFLGVGAVNLKVTYDGEGQSLVIRKPGVNIAESFTISLH